MQTVFATDTRPRRGRGCLGCLISLLILLIVVGALWFFVARPYLHNIAQTQLDQALTSATAQMPAAVSQLPPGPFLVQEQTLNNLIALNIAPSNPIQHAQAHITSSNMQLDFQLYGYPCSITGVPKAVNGELTMTNVTVNGVIALIMSPDELTPLLNQHLATAVQKMHHKVLAVQLKSQELGLLLG